ncbi:MAG: TM2 domain-containing protein [Planctomycetia bacterium]|nr:TM2 domain-containing protein [Planctomycetia bacterium]
MSSGPENSPAAAPGERPAESRRIMCGVLAIVLGGLGVHKFVLGLTTPGIIMLSVTLAGSVFAPCTLFVSSFGPVVMGVIGIIEGIIYLTKTDEEFYRIYEVEKKAWF